MGAVKCLEQVMDGWMDIYIPGQDIAWLLQMDNAIRSHSPQDYARPWEDISPAGK